MLRDVYVYVAAGGGLGAVARYLLSTWIAGRAGPDFPWGTFVINVSGSFLIARGRAASPRRGFLLAFWGITAWLTLGSATAALLVWAEESRAQMAGDANLIRAVGWAAIGAFALGLALGWRVQVQGERLVVAIFRPPAAMTARWVGGWAILAVLLLWLALNLGAFAATYGALSHYTLAS
ncbi:MAG TPA: hypothetical protein VID73_07230 [Ktedonobacterales bacterium]